MSEPPKPPPTKVEIKPGEDPWTALAREIAAHPEGPVALDVMSQINQAIRPREKAYARLVEACVKTIEESDSLGSVAELDLAKANWVDVCKEKLTPSMVEMVTKDAVDLVEQRKTQPPEMATILLDGADGRRDYGYELGGDLSGLQGTWHRLWALISMDRLFGHSEPSGEALQLRTEFEDLLGRPLAPVEWDQLVAHARRHCDSVMKARMPGGHDSDDGADT